MGLEVLSEGNALTRYNHECHVESLTGKLTHHCAADTLKDELSRERRDNGRVVTPIVGNRKDCDLKKHT